jgi:hypothetical protein
VASPVGGEASIKTGRVLVENRPSSATCPHREAEDMYPEAVVDEAELGQLASLIARLTPGQQRLVSALADGFRGGWLEPLEWERAWRGSNLSDDVVVGDMRTWLVRRPGRPRDLGDQAG